MFWDSKRVISGIVEKTPNKSGGYDLRNARYQGIWKNKEVSFIQGQDKNSRNLLVFEGFMDFLSSVEHFRRRRPNNNVIVLNSVSLTSALKDEIDKYKTVHCFLDNDDAGRESLKKIREMASGKEVVDQSRLYGGFKDFNEYLVESGRGLER